MQLRVALCVLLVLGASYAASSQWQYKPGTTYRYRYETDSVTGVKSDDENQVGVHLTADVLVNVLESECDMVLQLENVVLEEGEGRQRRSVDSGEFATLLQRHALRFAFQDGRIESICPSAGDDTRALNIKKGILSQLQNSMQRLDGSEQLQETDISGRCLTTYEVVSKGWSSTSIKKTKDLSKCSHRENTETALQAAPEKGSRSTPMVRGTQECQQSVQGGIIEATQCKETHVVRPFSRQQSGITTVTTQSLKLTSKSRASYSPKGYTSTGLDDLLYDHEEQILDEGEAIAAAQRALQDMIQAVSGGVQDSAPAKFAALVYALRPLKFAALRDILNQNQGNAAASKPLYDALPVLGTSASVRVMAEELKQNKAIGDVVANMWLASLAFVSNPTTEMIQHLTPVLNSGRNQAFLSISSLVHTYCQRHSNCENIPAVKEFTRVLYNHLGSNCDAKDARTVLFALKAIGNTGIAGGFENVLQKCYENKNVDLEVRVAAIQAYRRFSCNVSRSNLLHVYQNQQEEVEVRIAAYLSLMRCADENLVNNIKAVLETEKIKQVGSFVFSHIRNVAKYNSKLEYAIKSILKHPDMRTRFDRDFRKFSKNFFYNMFFDPLDTGFQVDADIIHTTDSYLPRSVKLNTTVEIFGRNINIFEVGARVEQLERFLEDWKPTSAQSNPGKTSNNKIDSISKRYNSKSRFGKEPKISVYLRTFGNEIGFSQFGGQESTIGSYDIMNLLVKLADPRGIDVHRSIMFLDSQLTVPSGNGMPMRLAVNGSASTAVSIGGKSSSHGDLLNIDGKIEPSSAVEISVLMSVDAYRARSGIKMIATLSSSWAVDGNIQIRQGSLVKAKFNLPQEKMNIITVKSNVFLVNSDKEQVKKQDERPNEMKSCTGSGLNRALGLQLCAQASFPASSKKSAPMYPLSGAAEIAVTLEKSDKSLTSYEIEAGYTQNADTDAAVFKLNTPNSALDREITVQLQHNREQKIASFKVRTPVKQFNINAQYNIDDQAKKIDVTGKVDGEQMFQVTTELRKEQLNNKGAVKYSPFLELRIRGQRWALIEGQTSITPGRKLVSSLKCQDLTVEPIELQFSMETTNKSRKQISMEIKSYALDSTVKGFIQNDDAWSTKLSSTFSVLNGRKQSMDLSAKLNDASTRDQKKYTAALQFQNSLHPRLNVDLKWDSQFSSGNIENQLAIKQGGGGKRPNYQNTLQISQVLRYVGNLRNNNAMMLLKLQNPESQIDWALDMKHEVSDHQLQNRISATTGSAKKFETVIELSVQPNIKADFQIKYPQRDMRLNAEISKVSQNEYKFDSGVQLRTNEKTSLTGSVQVGEQPSINAQLLIPNQKPITLSGELTLKPSNYILAGDLRWSSKTYKIGAVYKQTQGQINATAKLQTDRAVYSADINAVLKKNLLSAKSNIQLGNMRTITLETKLQNMRTKIASLDIMWDAKKNPQKHIAIGAELKTEKNKVQAVVGVKSPFQTIKATASSNVQKTKNALQLKSQASLQWQSQKEINMEAVVDYQGNAGRHTLKGDIKLTTPFRNFESVGVSVDHENDLKWWKSQVQASLPKNKSYSIASEGKFAMDSTNCALQAELAIEANGQNTKLVLQHELSQSHTTNKIELLLPMKKPASLEISGSVNPNKLNGLLKINTFLSGFETLSTGFEYNSQRPENKNMSGHIQWRSDKKIQGVLSVQQERARDGRHTLAANLDIATPFSNYEKLTAKALYENDGKQVRAETNISSALTLAAGLTASLQQQEGEAKIHMNSNLRNIDDFEANLSYSLRNAQLSAQAKLQHSNNKSYTLTANGKVSSLNDFNIIVRAETPIPKWQNVELEVRHIVKMTRSLWDISDRLMLKSGVQDFSMELASTLDKTSWKQYDLKTKVLASLPLKRTQTIKMEFNHRRNANKWSTDANVEHNGRSLNTLRSEIKFDDILNWEHTLIVDGENFNRRSLSLQNKNSLQNNILKHQSELQLLDNNNVRIDIDASVKNGRYENNLSGKINIQTTYAALKSLLIDGSFANDQQKIQPRISVFLNNAKQFEAEAEFKQTPQGKYEGNMSIESAMKYLEFYTVNGQVDLSKQQLLLDGAVQWSKKANHVIRVRMNGSPKENGLSIELNVVTPFRSWEKTDVNGWYSLNGEQLLVSAVANFNQNRASIDVDAKMSSKQASGKIIVQTPIKQWERQHLSAEWRQTSDRHFLTITTEHNNKKINAEIEMTVSKKRKEVKFSLVSPFKGFEQISATANASLLKNRKQVSLEINQTNKKYAASLDCNVLENSMKASVQSPIKNYEKLDLAVQGKADTMSAVVQWSPSDKLSLDATVNENKIDISVSSPFRGYERMRLSAEINKTHDQITGIAMVQKNEKTIKIESKAEKEAHKIQIVGNLETPFKNWEKQQLSLRLLNEGLKNIEVVASIETSLRQVRKADIKITYEKQRDGYLAKASMQRNDDAYELIAHMKHNGSRKINGEVKVVIPSKQQIVFSADVDIESIKNIRSNLSAEGLKGIHKLLLSSTTQNGRHNTEIEINCSVLSKNAIKMQLASNFQDASDVKTELVLELENVRHSIAVQWARKPDYSLQMSVISSAISNGKLDIQLAKNGNQINGKLSHDGKEHVIDMSVQQSSKLWSISSKLSSPLLSHGSVDITASLKSNEIVADVKSGSQYASVKGSMHISGLRNVNVDVNVDSSLEWLHESSLQAKYIVDSNNILVNLNANLLSYRNQGIDLEIRLNPHNYLAKVELRLPIKQASKIYGEANVQYNDDFSKIIPTVVLNLENRQYKLNSSFIRNRQNTQSSLQLSWPEKQILLTINSTLNRNRQQVISATLETPFRGWENQQVEISSMANGQQLSVNAVYIDARSRKSNVQTVLEITNLLNFKIETTIQSPLLKSHQIYLNVRQQHTKSRFSHNSELSVGASSKYMINIDYDYRKKEGELHIVTPNDNLKNIKSTYSFGKQNFQIMLARNNANIINIACLCDHERHIHGLIVELSPLSYAFEAQYKDMLDEGLDATIKIKSPSREIMFRLLHDASARQLHHLVELKWGEESNEKVSYEIQVEKAGRVNLSNNQATIKINFPLRSFEILLNKSSKRMQGNNVTLDILWDAARDRSKHIEMRFVHKNNSNKNSWAHNIEMSIGHPKLSKEIVVRADAMLSATEIYGKTELEYSEDRRQNIVIECKLQNRSTAQKVHYLSQLSVKQNYSGIDIVTNAEILNSKQEMSAMIGLKYNDRKHQTRVHELKAIIEKVRQAISLTLRKNEDFSELNAKAIDDDNEYAISMEHKKNKATPWTGALRLSKRSTRADLTINDAQQRQMRLQASMPQDRLQIELSHDSINEVISDAFFRLGLHDSQYLGTELKWRPDSIAEISNYLSNSVGRSQISDFWYELKQEAADEVNAKSKLFRASLSSLNSFVDAIVEDFNALVVDIKHFIRVVNDRFGQDIFYLNTIAEAGQKVLQSAGRLVGSILSAFNEVLHKMDILTRNILNCFSRCLTFVGRAIAVYINRIISVVDDAASWFFNNVIENLLERIENVLNNVVEFLSPSAEYFSIKMNIWKNTVSNKTHELIHPVLKSLRKNVLYIALMDYSSRVTATFNQFGIENVGQNVRGALKELIRASTNGVISLFESSKMQYVADVTSSLSRKTRSLYDQMEVPEFVTSTGNVLKSKLSEMYQDSFDYNADMGKGQMKMMVRLPSKRDSLRDALDVTSYPEYQRISSAIEEYRDSTENPISDSYYNLKNAINSNSLLPPYQGRAMIMGKQHYKTFDGAHFEFAGECSYLLAKDFNNNDFSVIVNYAKNSKKVVKKSLTVNTDNHEIEISTDGKIMLDGKKTELPQELGQTLIVREEETIVVNNTNGFIVKCNLEYDTCYTEMDGKYFGKTAGLLGTYDYEDSTDMMTPDHEIVSDIGKFAGTWEVGNAKCVRKNINLANHANRNNTKETLCNNYFKSTQSAFRRCFSTVDPQPFIAMCLGESSRQYDIVCGSLAAYRDECASQGIDVDMPSKCVRCQTPRGAEIIQGEKVTLSGAETKKLADIVFVVESNKCNRKLSSQIKRVAQSIHDSYRKKSQDVRFAVVGYSGPGRRQQPHTVTQNGAVFGNANSIETAVNSMILNHDSEPNHYEAIQYAANIPIRMGADRKIILVKCSVCSQEDSRLYNEVRRQLTEQSIDLHIMDDDDITVRSAAKSSKSKRILGADKEQVYVIRGSSLVGDSQLRNHVNLPKDHCIPLALESGGSYFAVDSLVSRTSQAQQANIKKMLAVMAGRIAQDAAPDCMVCQCVATEHGSSKSVCQACVSSYFQAMLSPRLRMK